MNLVDGFFYDIKCGGPGSLASGSMDGDRKCKDDRRGGGNDECVQSSHRWLFLVLLSFVDNTETQRHRGTKKTGINSY